LLVALDSIRQLGWLNGKSRQFVMLEAPEDITAIICFKPSGSGKKN
jgi:hypothetical protein